MLRFITLTVVLLITGSAVSGITKRTAFRVPCCTSCDHAQISAPPQNHLSDRTSFHAMDAATSREQSYLRLNNVNSSRLQGIPDRARYRILDFWGHHYGGDHEDFISDMTVSDDGIIAVCGFTFSSDLPVPGGYQTTNAGGGDAFLATFNADGTLRWATYLGGERQEAASGVCFDSERNICVAGATKSVSFPVSNPVQRQLAGDRDLFIAKFSISGDLLWSTYLGGSGSESMGRDGRSWGGLTVDGQDNIILSAGSESLDFPVKNAWQATNPSDNINVLVKLSPNGTILWATYLGGRKTTWCENTGDVGTDAAGNIYFSTQVCSPTFPVARAFQSNMSGPTDMYISKWTAQGQLIWGTYFGGNGDEAAEGLVVGPSGECIVVGSTASRNMPTRNPWQAEKSSLEDGAIACFDSTGALTYASFLGGDADDLISTIDCNASGDLVLAGTTGSSNFPLLDAFLDERSGGFVCMLHRESSDTYGLALSTYFGAEQGVTRWGAIEFTRDGSICFAGYTQGDLQQTFEWFTGSRHNGYDYEGFLVSISGLVTQVITDETSIPGSITLSPMWPQPAGDELAVSFTLPQGGWIQFDLYDLMGRHVSRLQSGAWYSRGTHTKNLRLPGLPPGMYCLQLRQGASTVIRKLLTR